MDVGFNGVVHTVLVWDRHHAVVQGEDHMTIALSEYGNESYWRRILSANGVVENPFEFKQKFVGKQIKLPNSVSADAVLAIFEDWVAKTNAEIK